MSSSQIDPDLRDPKPFRDKTEMPGFLETALNLPAPLFRRFQKQCAAGLLMAIVSVVLIIVTKELQYFWGFAFTIYLLYLAASLVWKFSEGKIVCKIMVCIKGTRISKERLFLILRERIETAQGIAQGEIHKIYLPAAKCDVKLISEKTVMSVYLDPRYPNEIIAWEIIGMIGDGTY